MNRITEVKLTLVGNRWLVSITKEFAPEHGGGSQVFCEDGTCSIHHALDVARGMVTLSPAQRTE